MFARLSLVLAATFAFAIASPAIAQSRQSLAEEYVRLPVVQEMCNDMFSPEAMTLQFSAGLPPGMNVTPSQKRKIGKLLSESINSMRPQMEKQMIASSARLFTKQELQALIDFSKSKHGSAGLRKMQPFMEDFTRRFMPLAMGEMDQLGPQIEQILMGN